MSLSSLSRDSHVTYIFPGMKRHADTDISKKSTQKPKLNKQKSRSFLIQDKGIKGELKMTEVGVTSDPSFGSNQFTTPTLLNGLAIGGDFTNRVGRKVIWTKIMMRWNVNQGSSTGGACFRLLVVYDKQANGVAPLITDILQTDSFLGFNNLNNRDRFITLIDEITPAVSQSGDASAAGFISRKLSLETIFNADQTAVIAAINTGSIYAMAAQTGGDLTQNADLNMRFRLRFNDS